jgi:hypothetical protein
MQLGSRALAALWAGLYSIFTTGVTTNPDTCRNVSQISCPPQQAPLAGDPRCANPSTSSGQALGHPDFVAVPATGYRVPCTGPQYLQAGNFTN